MEALRYREADDQEKILWQTDILAWKEHQGIQLPSLSTVTWADEGAPWLTIEIDDIRYNVNIDSYIADKGL